MEVIYSPLDFLPIMQRAFRLIRPRQIVLVEAEVWPNLAALARARSIPLALVNARLSPRSERRFLRFRFAVAPIFRLLDLVCAQEPEDVERWQSLGIPAARIHPVGSIKFDPDEITIHAQVPCDVLHTYHVDENRPVLLGGSTHAGEEEILADAFLNLRRLIPSLFLIIAPRHVERSREIYSMLQARGLKVALRTGSNSSTAPAPDCLLLDSTGELCDWYSVATVVFVGKSLTARGGQNPVEPIAANCPVIFGPHMENFASLAGSLLQAHGAIEVIDRPALEKNVAGLLHDPSLRARLVENARNVLRRHRGATRQTTELLVRLMSAQNASIRP
jgi:3-deoxy-D-manno-octulosonic-acid transferase